jgi:hypothetical protein
MNLVDVILAAKGRISGGSEYQWKCYGPNARFLDFSALDGIDNISVIFDAQDQTVYEIEVYPVDDHSPCYVWFNPTFRSEVIKDAAARQVDILTAYDSVKFTEVTSEQEILSLIDKAMNADNGK